MPYAAGKHYPYTKKGRAAAPKARKKKGSKKRTSSMKTTRYKSMGTSGYGN